MKQEFRKKDDRELFALIKSDERTAEQAFNEIYERYSPRVFAYCRRFLNNAETARDVFQETFLRFLNYARNAENEKDLTNVISFLLVVARNLCINEQRDEHKALVYSDEIDVAGENREDTDEMLNLIKAAMDLLPSGLKETFILREYDGLSYQEIAEITNSSVPAVKTRIHRARQKIREILTPYMQDMRSIK